MYTCNVISRFLNVFYVNKLNNTENDQTCLILSNFLWVLYSWILQLRTYFSQLATQIKQKVQAERSIFGQQQLERFPYDVTKIYFTSLDGKLVK